MIMSAWSEYKKKLGSTRPWDVLDPNVKKSTEDESTTRFNICLSCDRLMRVTNQCRECGCFMNLKVKLKDATCPLGKW
jgi:hypothetical protein